MDKEVHDQVIQVLSNNLSGDLGGQLNAQCAFTDLDLDSLALLEVVCELEEEFRVTLEAVQLDELHTVADLISAVDRQLLAA